MKMQATNIDVVLNSINAAVITIDTDGIILDANPATERLFGYAVKELIGKDICMMTPEPHRTQHGTYIDNYLRTGAAKIIGKGRYVEALHANGKRIPVHLSIGEHESDGKRMFTGILQDLTYQNQISESNYRLGRLFDESSNEVYVFDAESLKFKDVSSGALRNLGYTLDEIRTITPVDIKPHYNRNQFITLLAPLIDGSESRLRFSTVHQRKDGTEYSVDASLSYINSESGSEFFAIIEDVTDKNQLLAAMQQAQKMESVGQLTGGIAHDFNNLLTVIAGNLELAQSSELTEFQQELLKDAKDASDMGARLTNRLLAFASRSSLSPSLINLNELVIDTSEILRRTLGENITVDNSLHADLWLTRVDISQLENALINLAVNARDAMTAGGKLQVSTSNVIVDATQAAALNINIGEYVTVSVSDSGTGIAEEHLSKIFEPFFTTKSASLGTGLGLSMVYGFTRQSGGGITVQSTLNEGTEFILFLPRGHQTSDADNSAPASATDKNTKKLVILVVEDEDQVRTLTRRRLKKLGHDVVEASDGFEALDIYNTSSEIDLVISDMIMTEGMTGLDLAVAIREQSPQAKILIASGYSDELLDREKLNKMDIRLLRKPYGLQDLETEITSLFSLGNSL